MGIKSRSTWRQKWRDVIFWLFTIGASIYFEVSVEVIVTSLVAYILSKFFSYHRASSQQSNWLYNNDRLSNKELAKRSVKDISYAGLMYMASRENPASQEQIAAITSIMNKHFDEETFPVMVTININEERMGQSTHGKIFEDIKVMQRYLPEGTIKKIKTIYYQFAFDRKASTPHIEKGYAELMEVIKG